MSKLFCLVLALPFVMPVQTVVWVVESVRTFYCKPAVWKTVCKIVPREYFTSCNVCSPNLNKSDQEKILQHLSKSTEALLSRIGCNKLIDVSHLNDFTTEVQIFLKQVVTDPTRRNAILDKILNSHELLDCHKKTRDQCHDRSKVCLPCQRKMISCSDDF